jgi:hypothetical protein
MSVAARYGTYGDTGHWDGDIPGTGNAGVPVVRAVRSGDVRPNVPNNGDTSGQPGNRGAGGTWDSGGTDRHAVSLAGMKRNVAKIRYAVEVLDGASGAEVLAWLEGYGHTVSRSKVYPEVNRYRDAHGLSDDRRVHAVSAPSQMAARRSAPARRDVRASRPSLVADGLRENSTSSRSPMGSVPVRDGDTPPVVGDGQASVHSGVPTTAPNGNGVPTTPPGNGDIRGHHRPGDIPDEGDTSNPGLVIGPAQPSTGTPDPSPQPSAMEREERVPWVAFACYAVSVVSLAVSLNTSWRFFDLVLHIPSTYGERYVMFAVAELALVVCGAGMAVNVHRDGRPGSFQAIVWSMCAAMAYMAWAESAPEEAIGRIVLGPVLGTVMLHLGLGLELRARHQHAGTVARIGRELRERFMSRLGLADDGRDAAQRIRDRKAYAAAALSCPRRWPWSRQSRLERALLAAGVADDSLLRDRMLARLAVVQHAQSLSAVAQPSPWTHV